MKPKSATVKVQAVSSRVTTVAAVPTGSSLTATTTTSADAAAALNALVPPDTVASAVPPKAPDVRSQARKVIPPDTVPFQLRLAWKRTNVLASAASRRAALREGLPKSVQLVPASTLNCHLPLLLSTAVTAMPFSAPGSVSMTWPVISAETAVPGSDAKSSKVADRLFAPLSKGAELTKATLMKTVSVSLSGPPAPVLPWSLVLTVSKALPEKLKSGSKRRPSRAALISVRLPVNTMVASPAPVPLKNDRPVVLPTVSSPWVTVSVSRNGLPPASTSDTRIAFPPPTENTVGLLLGEDWAAGTVFTGASLTAVTSIVIKRATLSRLMPPPAVPPLSCTWKPKLA